VRDDQHRVARDGEVELERDDAERERLREGRQRVLGREPACAAMTLQIEPERRCGAGGDERRRQRRDGDAVQGQISTALKK
jgi:hypothetical protein